MYDHASYHFIWIFFEESYFQDFEYEHNLDREQVQHQVETLFDGMCFLTKQDVQNTLQ